ncbi:MAG: dTDP-4-dehydrorhamnose reductase [Pseudomonadota bacterium]
MKCLVIGQSGQLARAIKDEADQADVRAMFLNRTQCDLSRSAAHVRSALLPHIGDIDAIIIAAAYTHVDDAEADYDKALAVNGHAPGVIAATAAAANLPVIHLSTDYVFDGKADHPYTPDMPICPVNAYGRSKAIGEAALRSAQPESAILRTSWLFGATGQNFLTTMLRLGAERSVVRVVSDQIGRPTYVHDLARACLTVMQDLVMKRAEASGVFHVTNTGPPISWADFAKAIFAATPHMRNRSVHVEPIPSSEYPTAASRPAYSVMDTERFQTTFDFVLPDWQSGLRRALAHYATAADSAQDRS